MRKFYRLLSKHKHDVPDYKCNYKIILDSWENVPQLCYARVCSLREKEVGEESRWQRNRTGRPLSLLQIHRKNN